MRLLRSLFTVKAALIALALLGAPAHAQNSICPTPPTNDNSNRCASTAFVQNQIGAGLPVAGGTVLGNPTTATANYIATSAPILGIPGTSVGSIGFGNLSSGTVTLQPTTGTLGSTTWAIPVNAASLASSLLVRDANQNAFANNFTNKGTNIVSAGGVTVLTAASARFQFLSGTLAQTFQLPDATTLAVGAQYQFNNNSTVTLTITNNSGTTIATVPPGGFGTAIAIAIPTADGVWDSHFQAPSNVQWGTAGLTIGTNGVSSGVLTLKGSGTGAATITPQAAAGTTTLTLPNASGTLADGASSPLALDATTGNLTCATCVTSSGGGAISGTSPISVSAAGVVSITSPLPLTNGGTNANLTASAGGIPWSDASKLNILAGTATAALPLLSGASVTPSWAAVGYPAAASNGGLVYSTASALAILAGTATANQIPLSGSSTTPSWSTATYPATTAAGTVLGSASANVIAATATPTLGANGGTGGQVTLNGSTSGSAAVRVAAAAGTSTIFQLPNTNGASGNVLQTDGTGITAWTGAGTTTIVEPQGRLTLQSGVPVMTTSQSAKTSLLYDCSIGKNVPYYTGSVLALDAIPSCEATDAMVSAASAGQVVSGQVYDAWWEGNTNHNICLAMSASTGGGGGWASDTGSPSVTARGTGYSANPVRTATVPFLTNPNTLTNCFNGATNYGPITANKATYLGTVYASANGQISYTFGAAGSGGVAGLIGVWNENNRATTTVMVTDNGTSYTYASTTVRQCRASAGNQIQFVTGISEDGVVAYNTREIVTSSTINSVVNLGIGLDNTAAFNLGSPAIAYTPAANNIAVSPSVSATTYPGVGLHTISCNENTDGTTGTFLSGAAYQGILTVTLSN
jgi:hypothetical protein